MSSTDAEALAEALAREREARREAEQLLSQKTAELHRAQRELLLAREEAVTANRAKSQFLANMSHELRTPLNAILGYSEILAEETQEAGHSQYLSDLRRITAGGHHLLLLINDILDLSRVESGEMDLYYETVEIAPLVADVVEMLRPLIEKNENRISVDAPLALGSMRTDVTKLRQSLFNLLSNAAKFTTRGQIMLTVTRSTSAAASDFIEFQVRDSGIGMKPEQLRELFIPFTQADSSATRRFGGTGLGLAITARFCKLLGGTLSVDSELHKGSTFILRIPAAPPMSLRSSCSPSPLGSPLASPQFTQPQPGKPSLGVVLVVDDDPMVRDVISRTLSKEGYTVFAAADGEEALRLAKKHRPMVITLDVIMPKMDGWSFLSHLRADPELQKIPVLIISIMGDRGLGEGLGASEYLRKPVDRAALLQTLRSLAALESGAQKSAGDAHG